MILEWDEKKNRVNRIKHGLDFAILYDFVWEGALIVPDKRRAYGEPRLLAYGLLGDRLHVVVFTKRGDQIRIIGARKANARERRLFDENTTQA
jgi:uncharacterized DUF497 family protein